MASPAGPVGRALIVLVRGYQHVPKGMAPRCRFAPSCSEYAVEALRSHGARRGLWLTVRRLGRCHPFHPGGVDRVPLPAARRGDRSSREGAAA